MEYDELSSIDQILVQPNDSATEDNIKTRTDSEADYECSQSVVEFRCVMASL